MVCENKIPSYLEACDDRLQVGEVCVALARAINLRDEAGLGRLLAPDVTHGSQYTCETFEGRAEVLKAVGGMSALGGEAAQYIAEISFERREGKPAVLLLRNGRNGIGPLEAVAYTNPELNEDGTIHTLFFVSSLLEPARCPRSGVAPGLKEFPETRRLSRDEVSGISIQLFVLGTGGMSRFAIDAVDELVNEQAWDLELFDLEGFSPCPEADAAGVIGYPTTVLIYGGEVIGKIVGAHNFGSLRKEVQQFAEL